MTTSRHRGFVLVTVLIVTAIGLMFGVGALLLFRFQCQKRVDRQHELEKVYAVRSALNWVRSYATSLPTNGVSLKYYTHSSRSLDILVRPVEYLFPDLKFESNTVRHLVMEGVSDKNNPTDNNGVSRLFSLCANQYNPNLDYEYGMMTNVLAMEELSARDSDLNWVEGISNTSSFLNNIQKANNVQEAKYGISFSDATVTNVKWWVNVGMPGKGGWLHEEYGRRYYFMLSSLVSGDTGTSSDILHFCIIRSNFHPDRKQPGCRHGWPLSVGESALVLRLKKDPYLSQGFVIAAILELYECVYGKEPVLLARHETPNMTFAMGIQLAGKKASLFWFDGRSSSGQTQISVDIKEGDREMSDETYSYFRKGSVIVDGRIRSSPDLRAVFEVVAVSSVRSETNAGSEDFVEKIRVERAYQYDVFLKCPNVEYDNENGVLATVAQVIPKTSQSIWFPILTYDTHGTENKGFRKDEREAERKRGVR